MIDDSPKVTYKVYFLKPDKKDWLSRLIGFGLSYLGSDSDYTHVALTQESELSGISSLIEMTTEGLDIEYLFEYEEDYAQQIQAEIRREFNERFSACVTLEITLQHHVDYILSLDTLLRSNCRSHAVDFVRMFFGQTPNQPVCTYPVLELLHMKHSTYVLPKNLLGYFKELLSSNNSCPMLGVEIVSCQEASHDNDTE